MDNLYNDMKELYTVKVNSKHLPTLEECRKGEVVELIAVENGWNMVELIIESIESDDIELEYQESTYVVYITVDGDIVDRIEDEYKFKNMEIKEMISVLVNLFMERCS